MNDELELVAEDVVALFARLEALAKRRERTERRTGAPGHAQPEKLHEAEELIDETARKIERL